MELKNSRVAETQLSHRLVRLFAHSVSSEQYRNCAPRTRPRIIFTLVSIRYVRSIRTTHKRIKQYIDFGVKQ